MAMDLLIWLLYVEKSFTLQVSPSRERVMFMCVYERGNFEFEKDEGEIR
jgi:hypothetical protein